MMQFFLIRHAQSQGNEAGIIQGRSDHYGLSDTGHRQALAMAKRYCDALSNVEFIMSSTALRAFETANIFSQVLEVPVETDERLVEVDAGILGGVSHTEAEQRYLQAYQVWLARGDLDAIPNAESGAALQARVLSFLHDLMRRDIGSVLIVAHAALNRCLLNTASGKPRTTPIDVSHEALHKAKPHKYLSFERQSRGKKSDVWIADTSLDKMVIKETKGQLGGKDDLQFRILKALSLRTDLTPRVLFSCNRPHSQIKVLSFQPGRHIDGPLSSNTEKAFLEAVYALGTHLSDITRLFSGNSYCLTLADILTRSLNMRLSPSLRQAGRALESNEYVAALFSRADTVLVNLDLHRSNVLFKEGDVRFIDLETFALTPAALHLGSALVAGFMLEEPSLDNITGLLKYWPQPVLLEELYWMMLIRAFAGAAFFQDKIIGGESVDMREDRNLLDKYLRVISQINYMIKRDT